MIIPKINLFQANHRVKTPTILQMEAAECGAAALGIILAYYGHPVPLEELRVACGISRLGSKANSILKAAQKYGLEAHGYHKKLEGLPLLRAPFVVFWNFNHFVVVEGFRAEHVYINDPAYGPRTVTRHEFDTAFTGVVLTFEPTSAFTKGGTQNSTLVALLQRLRGAEAGLFWILLASLALAVLGLIVPGFLRVFVDDILLRGLNIVPSLLLLMGLAAIALSGLTWLQHVFLLRLETRLSLTMSSNFFWHVLRLPISFFAGRYAGEVANRITLNERVAQSIASELATALLSAVLVFLYIALMLQYDVALTVIGVGFAVLNLLALGYFARRRKDANRRLLQENGKLIGTAMHGLQYIETLKASGTEGDFFTRLAGYHANMLDAQQELGIASQITLVLPPLLTALNSTAILAIGSLRIMDGAMSIGMLVAFQWLSLSFLTPINQLVRLGTRFQEVDGDLKRLDDVLQHKQDVPPVVAESPVARLTGQVDLQAITFGYSTVEKPVIEGLSLSLRPGTQAALVGSSGSGKTTLAMLIAGLYAPWTGTILLGGQLRQTIPGDVLHNSVALIDEDSLTFEGTLYENLTLWDDTIPEDRLIQALKDVGLYEDVMKRPDGLEYHVEEQGRNFSGGQRQQLELARALVCDPAVLILDEALNALDTLLEKQILANLRKRECTCLLISHRLSTLRDCDEILVMENGEIAQRGVHAALLQAEGSYARLVQAETGHEAPETLETPVSFKVMDAEPDNSPALAEDRHSFEQRRLQEGFAYLAAVLMPRALPFHRQANRDPLFAACQLVAKSNGFSLKRPPKLISSTDRLSQIADGSRIRSRRITLQGNWWEQDNGPLLAYRQETRQPVALIPAAPRRYDLYDPVQGTGVPVTADVAATLASDGVLFYRPLPEGKLTAWAFLKFGLYHCQRDLLVISLAGIGLGLAQLALPFLAGILLDDVVPQANHVGLLQITLALIGSILIALLFMVTQNVALLRIESRMEITMQAALWDRLLRLSPAFFRQYSAGDLGDRAVSISTIRAILSNAILSTIFSGLISILAVGLLFTYSANLALIAVVLAAFSALVTGLASVSILRFQRQIAEVQGKLAGSLLQFITAIGRVRAAGAENRIFAFWAERFGQQRRLIYESRQVEARLSAFNATFPLIALMGIFISIALSAKSEQLSIGSFLAFNTAFSLLVANTIQISSAVSGVLQIVPLFERIKPILETPPEVDVYKAHPGQLSGAIQVEHVSFRYQRHEGLVLHDLSFNIAPGEFVAVVGPTGSGKSTLLRLLLGFDLPTSGTIAYDGQILADLDVEAVRRQIGVVLQGHDVIAGRDIYANIVGAKTLTLDEAWEAARLASLTDDIKRLPMGMHTIIMGGGNPLSAGQRQRLLIARAIAAKPRLLLFDEATSALDNFNQETVSQNLAALKVTRVVIAHRLTTIRHADRIIVMNQGRIVQTGTYDELSQRSGMFADLVQRQLIE